jgi:hypothetical protein
METPIDKLDGSDLALILGIHALVCLLLTIVMCRFVPSRFGRCGFLGGLLIYSMAFFVPYVGALALMATLHFGFRIRSPWAGEVVSQPRLPHRPFQKKTSVPYGEGGLIGVLRNSPDPERRRKALLATRQLPDKKATEILRFALRDPVDDVRLLAYAMMDRKEQIINQEITRHLNLLKDQDNPFQSELQMQLARNYWELVYLGLSQSEVREHVLGSARLHAELALFDRDKDAGLRLLLGRILLEVRDLDDAERYFEEAIALGLPQTKVLPYLAETHFYGRDFKSVTDDLRTLGSRAHNNPVMSQLASFWA